MKKISQVVLGPEDEAAFETVRAYLERFNGPGVPISDVAAARWCIHVAANSVTAELAGEVKRGEGDDS